MKLRVSLFWFSGAIKSRLTAAHFMNAQHKRHAWRKRQQTFLWRSALCFEGFILWIYLPASASDLPTAGMTDSNSTGVKYHLSNWSASLPSDPFFLLPLPPDRSLTLHPDYCSRLISWPIDLLTDRQPIIIPNNWLETNLLKKENVLFTSSLT